MPTSAHAPVQSSVQAPSASLRRRVLWMVLLNGFATPLMLSSTNVALPALAAELRLDAVALSWVPTAYLMASAMFVLIFGRLADLWGRKRIFLLGTAAVILSSLLAALSVSSTMLLSARFLQGVSTAMLYATQVALVASVFPAGERGRAIGLVVAAVYAGLASGPLLGGLVIEHLGWRAGFLLQVPLALVVLLYGLLAVRGEVAPRTPGRFDWPGSLAYAGGLLCLCLGVSLLPGRAAWPALLAGAVALAWFCRHALRAAQPLLDLRLFFSNRLFTLSATAALIMYSATYANVVLVSLYLQYLKGMGAAQAGLYMMLQPLTMALLSPLVGRLSDRWEPRLLASAGMLLTCCGLLILATLDAASSSVTLLCALGVTGLGFSLFSSPNVNAIMGAVDSRQHGSASAAVAITRILGQLLSMVLVSLALALMLGETLIGPDNLDRLEAAIRLSFSIAAGLCLPGIGLSLLRGRAHVGPASDSKGV